MRVPAIEQETLIEEVGDSAEGPTEDELRAQAEADAMREIVLTSIAEQCTKRFNKYADLRQDFERRWLDSLRAYNNKYDPVTMTAIKKKKGSQVYIGLTRKFTDGFSARLAGAAMPTDSQNWSYQATPIPEGEQLAQDKTPVGATPEGNQVQVRDLATGAVDAAKERAMKMFRKVQDQTQECDWNAQQRAGLDDASIYGMMVVEGPIVQTKTRVKYKSEQVLNEDKSGMVSVMMPAEESSQVPVAEKVSPWDFYWDTSVKDAKDLPDWFRRYPMNRKQLRDLLKQDGVIAEQVEKLMAAKKGKGTPVHSATNWESELRAMNGSSNFEYAEFEVIKYTGPITREMLEGCGCNEDDLTADEQTAVVWMCNGIVFKVDPMYLRSEQPLNVSVFSPFPDGITLCGFGVPELCQDPAAAVNATARAILDHAAAAAVPVRIVNKSMLKGQNGSYKIFPGATFENSEDYSGQDISKAIVNIETRVQLQAFFEAFNLFYKLMDDVTQLPQIQMGSESQNPMTARQATISANNSNEVLRRILKRYEDEIGDPTMTRFYHYNMQYDKDESLKGDYETVFRGVQALQEAESQGLWYQQMLQWVFHPQYGVWFKKKPFLDGMAKGQRINPDDVIATEEEAMAELQKMQAQQPQQADPRIEVAKMAKDTKEKELMLQDQLNQREMMDRERERQLKQYLEELSGEIDMAEIRMSDNQHILGIKQKFSEMKMKLDQEAKKINLEAQIERPNPRIA